MNGLKVLEGEVPQAYLVLGTRAVKNLVQKSLEFNGWIQSKEEK